MEVRAKSLMMSEASISLIHENALIIQGIIPNIGCERLLWGKENHTFHLAD